MGEVGLLGERYGKSNGLPFGAWGEAQYFSELVGKRVIIVGPAGYLRHKRKGQYIDSFDVVVRVNHALPIQCPIDYGSRTTVLYHILSHRSEMQTGKITVTKEEVASWDTDWVVSRWDYRSSRIRKVGPYLAGRKWTAMSHEFFFKVKKDIGALSPNTGVSAIAHLLLSELKSLNVIGFDFYLSGVYDGYGDVRQGEDAKEINKRWHDAEGQLQYLKVLQQRDNRLKFDDVLQGLVDRGMPK